MPDQPVKFERAVPEGDNRTRNVCSTCGFIDYVNPKIVAGAVVFNTDGEVLMCRRAIEPRAGFWTLPAGFMEQGESVEEAAKRETREEACAEIEIEDLIGVYSVPRISQVQIFFRARLAKPGISAGPESLEVRFFALDNLPEAEFAFPSVRWAIDDYLARQGKTGVAPELRTQAKGITPY
ncbi:MAG: FAD pyrophosphatase [Oceanicaulis sp. HLUCCA04]|nr:MAG: FAD pyrophosphatase [Oceanicaulis sp. HLUCCA04]